MKRWRLKHVFITALCAFATVQLSSAQTNLITNGGFSGGTAYNVTGSSLGGGWIVTMGTVDRLADGAYGAMAPVTGQGMIDLDGNQPGAISQTFATQAGQNYQVGFELSCNPVVLGIKTLAVSAGNVSSLPFSYNCTSTSNWQTNKGSWVLQTFQFTATTGSTTLTFSSTSASPSSPAGPTIADVSVVLAPTPAFFPQVAVGGGYMTQFTITNTGSTTASGNLTLTDPNGNPLSVNGTFIDSFGNTQPASPGSLFAFSIPSGGTVFLSAAGLTTSSPTKTGWAQMDSVGGTLTAVATYEYAVGLIPQTMVSVLQSQALQYMTIPIDTNASQNKQAAYAIANPSNQAINIKLALVGQNGTVMDDSISVQLGPKQYIAEYLWQRTGLTNFKGSLVLRGQAGATFVAVGLSDKQGLLTAIPLISGKAPGVPN